MRKPQGAHYYLNHHLVFLPLVYELLQPLFLLLYLIPSCTTGFSLAHSTYIKHALPRRSHFLPSRNYRYFEFLMNLLLVNSISQWLFSIAISFTYLSPCMRLWSLCLPIMVYIMSYPPEKTSQKQIQANRKSLLSSWQLQRVFRIPVPSWAFLRLSFQAENPHPWLIYLSQQEKLVRITTTKVKMQG